MGKTSDLFKNIGDINRTYYARTQAIKDTNDQDLTSRRDKEEVARLQRRTVQTKILMT